MTKRKLTRRELIEEIIFLVGVIAYMFLAMTIDGINP